MNKTQEGCFPLTEECRSWVTVSEYEGGWFYFSSPEGRGGSAIRFIRNRDRFPDDKRIKGYGTVQENGAMVN